MHKQYDLDGSSLRATRAGWLMLLLPLGCSSPSPGPEPQSELGALEIELTAPDQTGRTYRLRDAQFIVTPSAPHDGGALGAVLSSESAPDAVRINARLFPGNYRIELEPGWRMEELTIPPVNVSATLLSEPTQFFSIRRFSTTFVNYQFGVSGEPLAFGGDLSIGITVISADAGAR
jgi:hypothetical protein